MTEKGVLHAVFANLKYIPEGNLGKSLFTWQPYTCSLIFP
ncbi:hypothetical protein HMPREF1554_00640 [Porphyromonas gingivalis F0569]|nr:hypothetical protein HMPREF1554_00640 [Porphyromonas gingivalis F0569]